MVSADLARYAALAVGGFQVLANGLSGLLLLIAAALGKSDPIAQRVALAIAAHYVVVGVATFSFAPGRQHGLLVFSLLGAVLGAAVLLSKSTQ
jgi:hypothetical protein